MAESDRRGSSLVAEFRSPAEARAAIEALEHHGIDGAELAVPARGGGRRQPADRRTLLHIGGRAGKGVLIGAVMGAAVFALVAVVFLLIGWPIGAAVALVLAGAAIGATAGAFIGVERGVGMSEEWEQTFHQSQTSTVPIEVHTRSAGETVRARQVLEDHQPVSLRDLAA
jgi:hypothetical protein